MCVCVLNGQPKAEWILTKCCRRDPWVPTMLTKKNCLNDTPIEGKRSLKCALKIGLKNVAQWFKLRFLKLKINVSNMTWLIFSSC